MNKRIISDPAILSGTPVFLGTRIPLDHIAGLCRKGVPASEIAQDYPSLSAKDIAYARSLARRVKSNAPPPGGISKPIQLRRKTRAA
jgi:uncharacterized protein (DUF433 family)